MPNALAFLMLLIWPVLALQLYRRLDPARALAWTILGGYLLLPPVAAFNLPVVPDFDKSSIPNLAALALTVFVLGDRPRLLPDGLAGRALIGVFVLSPFMTVLTNPDPIDAGNLPGLTLYDSVAAVTNQIIALLPFLLARRYLATPEALRALMGVLVAAGLVYSLPMLVEIRLSPQINVWVYGFFQHSFEQMMREGGFRPIVFLPHGLWAAFFVTMTVLAAASLLRAGPAAARPKWLLAFLYLFALLVLCKSVAALVYAALLAPVILFGGRRTQLLLAALLAAVVMTYPLLRGAHLIPLDQIMAVAERISPERAQSLKFRIDNEEILLNLANQRPLFGWGQWGRNLIHDPVTGRITTITDGQWIIVMGVYGWLGYIAQFGLLVLPLLLLGREALRRPVADLAPHGCALALILAANLVDLLPNATIIPFTWLMAGALLGMAEALRTRPPAARAGPRPVQTVL